MMKLEANARAAPHHGLLMASRTASVSYKKQLDARRLAKALVTGEVPAELLPHVATFLDEAPLPFDFVASPNLTAAPFETWSLQRRSVRVETAAEIVAKKVWHRGDQVSARDLFDLSLVIEREPESLRLAEGPGARRIAQTVCQRGCRFTLRVPQ